MLDIADAGLLDKERLIGGCVRLRVAIDAGKLQSQMAGLPSALWGTAAGRVGVHRAAEALFLRGYAPAEGDRPVADRPSLDALPYVRTLIEELIPATPLRCLLARLPADTIIATHVDRPPYFGKTLRLHVPIETNPDVFMVAAGLTYRMQAGEIWVLNNSAPHAVWNAHARLARTHLICDFLPSAALLELLASGERDLGEHRADVDEHLMNHRQPRAAAGG